MFPPTVITRFTHLPQTLLLFNKYVLAVPLAQSCAGFTDKMADKPYGIEPTEGDRLEQAFGGNKAVSTDCIQGCAGGGVLKKFRGSTSDGRSGKSL